MELPPFSSPNSKNLLQDIVSQIELAIRNGKYAVGDRLPSERELQNLFGVGRGSIREALRMLRQKGWLESRRGKNGGTFVCKPTMELVNQNMLLMLHRLNITVDQLVEFRQAMDAAVYWLFIKNYSEDDARKMRQKCEEISSLIAEQKYDIDRILEIDLELYHLVAESTKNSIVVWMYDNIYRCLGYFDAIRNLDAKYIANMGRDWSEFIEAMLERNTVKFYALLFKHYDQLRTLLNEYIKNIPDNGKLFQNLKNNDLSGEVASKLEEALYSGRYAIGDKLPNEQQLQKIFGVGRSSIREALRILQQKGWIESKRGVNGGIFVCKPNIENMQYNVMTLIQDTNISIKESLEFRMIFDKAVFDLFSAHYTENDAVYLREKCKELYILLEDGQCEISTISNLDIELCRQCAKFTKNTLMLWLYDNIRYQFGYQELFMITSREEFLQLAISWDEYIEALLTRDIFKFNQLTYQHYQRLSDLLTENLNKLTLKTNVL